jgi:hypothetical protein
MALIHWLMHRPEPAFPWLIVLPEGVAVDPRQALARIGTCDEKPPTALARATPHRRGLTGKSQRFSGVDDRVTLDAQDGDVAV